MYDTKVNEEIIAVLREEGYTLDDIESLFILYVKTSKAFVLLPSHGQKDVDDLMKSLEEKYYSGFGDVELNGLIWMNDGTWFSFNLDE